MVVVEVSDVLLKYVPLTMTKHALVFYPHW